MQKKKIRKNNISSPTRQALALRDDLSQIVSTSFRDCLQSIRLTPDPFLVTDPHTPLRDSGFIRPHKFDIQTVIRQRSHFVVTAFISDADDGIAGGLNKLDQCCISATIACAHTVALIHDNYVAFFGLSRILQQRPFTPVDRASFGEALENR
jgi:hypothetical protein